MENNQEKECPICKSKTHFNGECEAYNKYEETC